MKNNDELISKDGILNHLYSKQDAPHLDVMLEIADYPATDAVEVIHGKWIKAEQPNFGLYVCSNCYNCYIDKDWIVNAKWQFCPCCGSQNTLEEQE